MSNLLGENIVEARIKILKQMNVKKIITLITTCPFCGRENSINVCEEDYSAWQNGALVQDAFPYLLADEREMLISGFAPLVGMTPFLMRKRGVNPL